MHRVEGEAEDRHEEGVLDHPEPFVEDIGHGDLRHAETLGQRVGKLLQRAEGAEPAAEYAAAPEEQAERDEAPEDEDHRLDQEGLPAESGEQRVRGTPPPARTESWPPAIHPSQTSVTVRKA